MSDLILYNRLRYLTGEPYPTYVDGKQVYGDVPAAELFDYDKLLDDAAEKDKRDKDEEY